MLELPPLNVPELLGQYQLHPDHRLGQNFLVEPSALDRVVKAADVGAGDSVLEVGAGLGSLTRVLSIRAAEVVAVEMDPRLIQPLKEVLATFQNVRLIQGDILALNPAELRLPTGYLVVANIPYYITSAVIRHLLEANPPPQRMVLTIQREVAERIIALPGKMSLLSLSVQVYGSPKIIAHIPAGAFYPVPKVDSAVVRVDLYPSPLIPMEGLDTFFKLVKAGFSQKRKTLRNALAAGLHWDSKQTEAFLRSVDIDPRRRAETLSLDEWKRLVENSPFVKP